VFRSLSQSNKARLALKIHQRVKQTLLKTCSKPFKCKTNDSATTSQEFKEKKTTKTKQRTPSDKQEKHKNKES